MANRLSWNISPFAFVTSITVHAVTLPIASMLLEIPEFSIFVTLWIDLKFSMIVSLLPVCANRVADWQDAVNFVIPRDCLVDVAAAINGLPSIKMSDYESVHF